MIEIITTLSKIVCAVEKIDRAVMLSNIHYWVKKNEANDTNFYDGRYWTFNSYEAFTKLFPFWSVQTVRTIITWLVKEDYLLVGNYNKQPYDNTKWYTTTDKAESLFADTPLLKLTSRPVKTNKSTCENQQVDLPKLTSRPAETNRPIPNINTNINNNINKNIYGEKEKKRFVPPTVEEVQAYINEKDYSVNAESFVSFYESKNWYVGKNKMVDWKSSVRYWNSNHKDWNKGRGDKRGTYNSNTVYARTDDELPEFIKELKRQGL